MTSEIRKHATLIKQVFSGDKGKELLELWKSMTRPVFYGNPREQDVLLGKQLHIEEIEYLLKVSKEELKEMEAAQTYDNSDDIF